MSIDYVVRTKYEVVDSHSAAIDRMASKTKGFGSIADSAKDAIDGLVSKLASLAKVGAGIAVGGGLLAMKTGLVDINAEIESATIGFTSVFRMLGSASNWDQGMSMAKELIAGIRKDAAALPGEFGDFVDMAGTLAPTLTAAGKGIEDIRKLTSATAIAAASVKLPFDQAAREMAELLEGRAGTHNKLGMRMGITTHTLAGGTEFNKASFEERLKLINDRLKNSGEALKAYEKSWKGLTSTMSDSVKSLMGRATAPLFERAKVQLERINKLLGGDGAGKLADRLADALARGFDRGVSLTERIAARWDGISATIRDSARRLQEGFERALPIAEKLGKFAAENPGAVFGGMAAARIGIGVATSPVASAAMGAIGGAAGGAALAGAATAAVAAAGAIDLLTAKAGELPPKLDAMATKSQEYWSDVKGNFSAVWDDIKQVGKDLFDVFRPLVDLVGFDVIVILRGLSSAVRTLSGALRKFTGWLRDQLAKIGLAAGDENTEGDENFGASGDARDEFVKKQRLKLLEDRGVGDGTFVNLFKIDTDKLAAKFADANNKAKGLHGAGKMNVTVNAPLQVLSDADPERIAKSVATVVASHLKNPKTTGALAALRFAP